jgi:hypothetical protein
MKMNYLTKQELIIHILDVLSNDLEEDELLETEKTIKKWTKKQLLEYEYQIMGRDEE